MKSLCVFCGSSLGAKSAYQVLARSLGELLAREQIRLIYGGAKVGLMGAVADGVLAGGGKVTGVLPQHLMLKEVAHEGLTELHIVKSMHERKALMAELADGFIALPGGFGTFEEFFEILTWAQLGLHQKPIGILNAEDYYKPLIELAEMGVREQFIRPEHSKLICVAETPEDLLAQFRSYKPLALPKWIPSTSET